MILKERDGELKSNCKPRASGDDPEEVIALLEEAG